MWRYDVILGNIGGVWEEGGDFRGGDVFWVLGSGSLKGCFGVVGFLKGGGQMRYGGVRLGSRAVVCLMEQAGMEMLRVGTTLLGQSLGVSYV